MEYAKMGKESAQEAVNKKLIDYKTLKAIAELGESIKNYPPDEGEYEVLKRLVDKELSSSLWNDLIDEEVKNGSNEDADFDENAFVLGFIDKVADIWKEVERKI